MRGIYPFIVLGTLAVTAFFLWARGQTRRKHACFRYKDVRGALEQVLSPSSFNLDKWELFLRWPIDDPYLEAIRQRCRRIVADWPRTRVTEYLGKEGLAEIQALYEEFCSAPSHSPKPPPDAVH